MKAAMLVLLIKINKNNDRMMFVPSFKDTRQLVQKLLVGDCQMDINLIFLTQKENRTVVANRTK
jgi:hypothetical protein